MSQDIPDPRAAGARGSRARLALSMGVVGSLVLGGCASVQVNAPKEPIKMDISMRLDVYQHVVKDIDDIESIVAGGGKVGHLLGIHTRQVGGEFLHVRIGGLRHMLAAAADIQPGRRRDAHLGRRFDQ